MSSENPMMKGRNILGQKRRPRRLKKVEREVLINTVESAMNDGRCTEARVYWNDLGIWCAPVQVMRTEKLGT